MLTSIQTINKIIQRIRNDNKYRANVFPVIARVTTKTSPPISSGLSGVIAAGCAVVLLHLMWKINTKQTCLIGSKQEGG